MVTVFGIKNCDTVRKARRWLDGHKVQYRFHDVRADGLPRALLEDWARDLGWENLLNRRSTTWRGLPGATRESVDARSAVKLMLEHPTLIRRPVLEIDSSLHLGFSKTTWKALFSAATS